MTQAPTIVWSRPTTLLSSGGNAVPHGAAQGRTLTGDGQVGGGLRLSGGIVGKALEHARVVGQQAADLQAAIAALLEAGQLLHLHQCSVLVPGDRGRRHPCGRPGPPSAPASPRLQEVLGCFAF